MNEIAEFLRGASNVYRTRDYIVRQVIELHSDGEGGYLVSRDTYFRCTPRRDREYEEAFAPPCGRERQTYSRGNAHENVPRIVRHGRQTNTLMRHPRRRDACRDTGGMLKRRSRYHITTS